MDAISAIVPMAWEPFLGAFNLSLPKIPQNSGRFGRATEVIPVA